MTLNWWATHWRGRRRLTLLLLGVTSI